MTSIRLAKTIEKELRPLGDRSVELHFDFCFQQNAYGGWGPWLRVIGRGPQEIAMIAMIAKIAGIEKQSSTTTPLSQAQGRSGQAAEQKGDC
jgi:hypothetical protein